MKLLITGSEGSLMQAVIPGLLAQGHEVRGVDSFMRYGRIDRDRNYEFLEGDLVDRDFAVSVVEGTDGIIQAAARIYGVGGFHKYPAQILSHDITLHQNVLWAAQQQKVSRVVYISSSMVFERCEVHPSAEEDAFRSTVPSTDYGLSKLVGERLSLAFHKQYGLEYVIWRPFNIITPYEMAEDEQGISHVFADFISNIVMKGTNPLPVIGDGEQVRCFTWIDDVASAIASYSFSDRARNSIFNLGNREPVTMKQLAHLIYDESVKMGLLAPHEGGLRFHTTGSFEDDVRVRIPDVRKAKEMLGWQAEVPVQEAVRRCLAVHQRGAAVPA